MQRITTFYKRIFPAIWFGFLGIVVCCAGVAMLRERSISPAFVIIPAGMILFGLVLMKALVSDLVDEVNDTGDSLLVRNGELEEVISYLDVLKVIHTPLVNPSRVTIVLRTPCRFGREFTFAGPERLNFFTPGRVISDLIIRIEAASMRPTGPQQRGDQISESKLLRS